MFLAGIAAMLVGYVLAPAIIRILFERGQFGPDDTAIVADALRYGLPQLPFYFSSMVLVSYALSQRKYRLIFWSGVIGCAGKIVGNILLVPALGINGIALAATLVYGLNAAFFRFSLRPSQSAK
jgi:putative peptidoglycan lipid II flippase